LQYPVSYYFHEPGMTRRVVSVKFPEVTKSGGFVSVANWTGPDVVAAEVKDVPFPVLLEPKDDLPPATLITRVRRDGDSLRVQGLSQDDGTVASVSVNNTAAKIISQHAGVADWEVTLPVTKELTAKAKDAAGNEERWPHVMALPWK
jgi:hypothetical protein